jgi:hypothetical protein
MTALLVIGGILSVLGLGFAMSGSVATFGLGLVGLGLFCGICAAAIRKS